jgi:hypothetical protein
LFKSALFIRTGKDADAFRSGVCDSQSNVTSSDEMARFWLRFLGCALTLEPRVATQRFYDTTLEFINDVVTDPVEKDTLYEHLQSQLKAPQKTLSPKSFIQNYVPNEYQIDLTGHLNSSNALATFKKDVSDIRSRLQTSAYLTAHGVRVSVPAETSQMVDVSKDQIIVNDSLVRVDRK